MLGWMKHKLESGLPGEISITSEMQMTPPLWQKVKRTKKPLDESERGEWKSCLKAQHSEDEDHGIWSHHFMGNRWGNSGNSIRLYFFWAPESLQMVIAAMKLKDAYSLEGKLWPTWIAYSKTDITLPTKVRLVKAMVFPVVTYECESWTIKKAECRRIDSFELWCWRRLLRVPWTANPTSPF